MTACQNHKRRLSKFQIPRPHPRSTGSEIGGMWGGRAGNLNLSLDHQVVLIKTRFTAENHLFRAVF